MWADHSAQNLEIFLFKEQINSQDFEAMILAVMETVTRIILHHTLKQLG